MGRVQAPQLHSTFMWRATNGAFSEKPGKSPACSMSVMGVAPEDPPGPEPPPARYRKPIKTACQS